MWLADWVFVVLSGLLRNFFPCFCFPVDNFDCFSCLGTLWSCNQSVYRKSTLSIARSPRRQIPGSEMHLTGLKTFRPFVVNPFLDVAIFAIVMSRRFVCSIAIVNFSCPIGSGQKEREREQFHDPTDVSFMMIKRWKRRGYTNKKTGSVSSPLLFSVCKSNAKDESKTNIYPGSKCHPQRKALATFGIANALFRNSFKDATHAEPSVSTNKPTYANELDRNTFSFGLKKQHWNYAHAQYASHVYM